MTSYRPSAKTLPFVLLGLFGILYIYDAGLEQEKILPEIVSETISVPTQNTPGVQTTIASNCKFGDGGVSQSPKHRILRGRARLYDCE